MAPPPFLLTPPPFPNRPAPFSLAPPPFNPAPFSLWPRPQEAESQSVPVEAVLRLAQAAGGGAKGAVLRARAALGAELRLLMTSSGSDASGPALKEAAVAWIRAHGNPALALQGMMGERKRKVGGAWKGGV